VTASVEYTFTYQQKSRPVVVHGTDRRGAVVLMHELSGLGPGTEKLAKTIASRGYQVHLPALIGNPGQQSNFLGALEVFCLRHEFTLLATDRTSPVADWVRALCRQVMSETGDRPVGVVGLCLTGGVALACALDPTVAAAVSSEPSLPIALGARRRKAIGLSPADMVAARTCRTPILALRFREDRLCPRERLETVEQTFPDVDVRTVPPDNTDYQKFKPPIKRRAHSVLTADLAGGPEHPTHEALDRVLEFLDIHVARP
jgi:dienelactone hydrolase